MSPGPTTIDNLIDSTAEALGNVVTLICLDVPKEIANGVYGMFCGSETFITTRPENPDENRPVYNSHTKDSYLYNIRGPPS